MHRNATIIKLKTNSKAGWGGIRKLPGTAHTRQLVSRARMAMCLAWALMVGLSSCSNIDCPLSNTVTVKYVFYNSGTGSAAMLKDTLTVTAAGTDTVLYNLGVNLSELQLPMSYRLGADTLLFHISSGGAKRTDTVVVAHTNEAHFESVDCSPAMFHTITSANVEKGSAAASLTRIDSVCVNNSKVSYDIVENIKVYVTAAP